MREFYVFAMVMLTQIYTHEKLYATLQTHTYKCTPVIKSSTGKIQMNSVDRCQFSDLIESFCTSLSMEKIVCLCSDLFVLFLATWLD